MITKTVIVDILVGILILVCTVSVIHTQFSPPNAYERVEK